MKTKQILFTEINTAKLVDKELPPLSAHDVMIKTAVSTISSGTERANITGAPAINVAGEAVVSFPRALGYNSAGVVVAVGSEVESVKVGQRVVVYWGLHQGINVVNENNVVVIEDDNISFESAAVSFISTFPMAAIRKTRLEIGESAMVMGLGILGIIAVKLLRAAGAAPIIAVDPNPARREIAIKEGADYALDPFDKDFAKQVKAVSHGGVNVAIEVTGVGAGFNETLDCMAKFGRIALLGCTRSSDFTVDYYNKIHVPGITVIGAHTLARPEVESYPGYFTHRDDILAVLRLCSLGRLDLDRIIEETHSPADCESVFNRLVFDKDFPIVVQFDWREIDNTSK